MKKKKVVGYTTGVFDMFHIGHLNILRKAKNECDFLIVGVSTDELVEEYKKKTPIIPYEDRVEILKSIRYVDLVVPQVNRNKLSAYSIHRFDKMFVGSDWKNSPLFQSVEEEFKKVGVEVVYFEYTKRISSTKLRKLLELSF